MEWFRNRNEAKVVIETWRRHYNEVRSHSSLGQQAPAAFRKSCGIAAKNPRPPSNDGMARRNQAGQALAEKAADFGRFGWWPPAAHVAGTPRGAGISGKEKGPATIRALVNGSGVEPCAKPM
jgi:hypothetical protein